MIPTSIDGTDITGATIDGTDVQEITVDGQTVFTSAPQPLIIDDFESQSLANYNNTGEYFFESNAISGNYSLANDGEGTSPKPVSTSGLANYPGKGDVFEYLAINRGNPDGGGNVHFGVDSSGDISLSYLIQLRVGPNELRILDRTAGELASTSVTLNDFDIYRVEIEWHDGTGSQPDNTIVASVFDVSGPNETGTFLASTSAQDSTYQNNTGIAYDLFDPDYFIDDYKITGSVA